MEAWQTSDTNIADNDSEGNLTFTPSGFTVTASALANPPPNPINDPLATQQAGVDFALHIAAYGTTATDSECGIIETYQGARSLDFWTDYVNPGSGTILATINGITVAASSGAATVQTVNFSNGQASVTARYKDAGSIALNVRDDVSFSTILNGASNNFVVQPDFLEVSTITSAALAANPAASSMIGSGFVPSGEAFRVVVSARDAQNAVTPNFGLESAAEAVRVSSESLVLPVGGRNGSTGDVLNGASFTRTGAGTFTATNIVFDEVGIIRLQAQVADSSYLGTGLLDTLTSANVGRFYPHHFELTSDAVSGACNNVTYADQDGLSVEVDVQAHNALGTVVENYDLGLLGSSGVAAVTWSAENNDVGVSLGSRLTVAAGIWVDGEYSVNDSGAVFARLTSPDGPYDDLQLGVRVVDALDSRTLDALDMDAATTGDCSVGGTCDAQSIGGVTAVRYGRVTLGAGMAPEFEALNLPVRAEYWDGSGFVLNTSDDCSTYVTSQAALSAFQGNLSSGETTLTQPLSSQTFEEGQPSSSTPYLLGARGLGNDGSVLTTLDVEAWLEFDWFGGGMDDPSERQTFGHYRGHDSVIYWDEVTR